MVIRLRNMTGMVEELINYLDGEADILYALNIEDERNKEVIVHMYNKYILANLNRSAGKRIH